MPAKDGANRRFWEKFAKIYTAFMSKNDFAYDLICGRLEAYVDGGTDVLELACGTGQVTFRMAAKSRSWEATDYSANMIQEAEKRNKGEQRCDKICFSVQDAVSLPYENERFDVVVIANALHIMPDPGAALREIHRVLRKDGILFAPTFVYEKGYSKLLIFGMERFGFRTYHKWRRDGFAEYAGGCGFHIASAALLEGKPLSECVLVGEKR